MNRNTSGKVAIAAVVLGAAVLIVAFASGKQDTTTSSPQKLPSNSRVTIKHGETGLTLSSQDQSRLALETVQLAASSHQQEATAAAVILPAEKLLTLEGNASLARANVKKARATLEMTRKEFERLKKLYDDQQNVAEKTLETQRAALSIAEADLAAAKEAVLLQQDTIRQQWGATVAQWMTSDAPQMKRVLGQQELLVQVTFDSVTTSDSARTDSPTVAPRRLWVTLPDGGRAEGSYVSPFPQIDPRFQHGSSLYIVAARAGLVPGLNLAATWANGARTKGVLIPGKAVLWWQGKAWAYVQTGATTFVRREVSTEMPAGDGYFVTSNFAAGDRVVTGGAQLMLSEEARPPVAPTGDGDAD